MALKLCNETSEFISICSLKPGYNSEDTVDGELEAEGILFLWFFFRHYNFSTLLNSIFKVVLEKVMQFEPNLTSTFKYLVPIIHLQSLISKQGYAFKNLVEGLFEEAYYPGESPKEID